MRLWPKPSRSTFRLLRELAANIARIADALEQQNRIMLALSPSTARAIEAEDRDPALTRDSGPSYPDPVDLALAEAIREEAVLRGTRMPSDEELVALIDQQRGRS